MQQCNTRFPRSHRLLTSGDYSRVFQRPIKYRDAFFIFLCRGNSLSIARLGLAVAKKNICRAVDRNLIKRMIRESFKVHQGRLAGFDIVVLTRPGLPARDKRALRASLDKLWEKLIERSNAT